MLLFLPGNLYYIWKAIFKKYSQLQGPLEADSSLKSFTVCEGELCFYTIHRQFMNEQIILWVSCVQTYVLFFKKNYCRNFLSGRWILMFLPRVRHTCLFTLHTGVFFRKIKLIFLCMGSRLLKYFCFIQEYKLEAKEASMCALFRIHVACNIV